MRQSSILVRSLLTAALFGGLLAGAARAEFIGADLVWVAMTDEQGRTGRAGIENPYDNLPPQANVPPFVQDMINERFAVTSSGGHVLGWVDSIGVELEGDPVASIHFNVTAGDSDVTVTVNSATVAFPALNNPSASAEAEITLTGNGGGEAMIDTTGDNLGLFRALFNGDNVYAELLGGESTVGGGSVTFGQDTSGPIAGSVSSIRAQFSFVLSAGDSAEGTGVFTVVPEPVSIGLVLTAGLALAAAGARRQHGSGCAQHHHRPMGVSTGAQRRRSS